MRSICRAGALTRMHCWPSGHTAHPPEGPHDHARPTVNLRSWARRLHHSWQACQTPSSNLSRVPASSPQPPCPPFLLFLSIHTSMLTFFQHYDSHLPPFPLPSIITSMFDDFMLLVGGRAAYAGPWGGAVDVFASAG